MPESYYAFIKRTIKPNIPVRKDLERLREMMLDIIVIMLALISGALWIRAVK